MLYLLFRELQFSELQRGNLVHPLLSKLMLHMNQFPRIELQIFVFAYAKIRFSHNEAHLKTAADILMKLHVTVSTISHDVKALELYSGYFVLLLSLKMKKYHFVFAMLLEQLNSFRFKTYIDGHCNAGSKLECLP